MRCVACAVGAYFVYYVFVGYGIESIELDVGLIRENSVCQSFSVNLSVTVKNVLAEMLR